MFGADIESALKKQGIVTPTDIQNTVMPLIEEGKDVLACSETGTGKTLSYLLPLFKGIDKTNKNPQCLVLAPTHELAAQIHNQLKLLNSNLPAESRIESALLIGGANITRQLEAIKQKPRILVGSSGRILELVEMKKLSLHFVKKIVLDEADRLLKDNFIGDVSAVIKKTQKDRQLLMFSASIHDDDRNRAAVFSELVFIDLRKCMIPDTIEHIYIVCELRNKFETLRKLLHTRGVEKAIVFVNSPYHINAVCEKLNFHKIKSAPIYGEVKKAERAQAAADFASGRINVLVASDLVSRGLDVKGVTHIINLDFPNRTEDYIHRAGRCGRMGTRGVSASIVIPAEIEKLKKCGRQLKIEFSEKAVDFGKLV